MNKEAEQILIDNLKETLKQFQSYLLWGIVAAITYYLLVLNKSSTTNLELPVIGNLHSVDTSFAKHICLAVYWLLGLMAGYALERTERISIKLNDSPEILKAASTYPSIATEIYPLVRVLAGLLPVAIMVFARIEIWNRSLDTDMQIYKLLLLAAPYLTIVVLLIRNALPLDKPAKVKIEG
jgi:hypothetical protein